MIGKTIAHDNLEGRAHVYQFRRGMFKKKIIIIMHAGYDKLTLVMYHQKEMNPGRGLVGCKQKMK